MRLSIKPLSVNDAWQGKRYRTEQYKAYQQQVSYLLRPMEIPEGPLQINLKWGFSSAGSDFDNPIKPFVDCLQKKYGFNDNRIKRAVIDVERVKKGQEFIEFEIQALIINE